MALSATALALLNYANGQNIWFYRTADAAATVEGANYFNGVAAQLNEGDIVFSHTGVGGTQAFKVYVVSAIADGAVTVTELAPGT